MRIPLTKDGLNANHRQGKGPIVLHDRINDAYRGEMGEEFKRKTKKRVDWIVSHVSGGRVLDVGCSQGIIPVLLAKEGVKVTGIDIDQKVIDEAIKDIENSPKSKSNITFICADFLKAKFEGRFDSILLTEVLEHTYDPEDFIERSFKLTKENGGLIVTVPFGINDHPDHRQSFYLVELYGMISQYYYIEDVQIIEKWIGFAGRRRGSKVEKKTPPVELLNLAEEAFYNIERSLTDRNYELVDQVSDLEGVYGQLERARKYASQLYRQNKKLEYISESKELKVGKALTYIPKKVYKQKHVNKLIEEVYYLAFPNKRRVIKGSSLRYKDLFKTARPDKFYLKRIVDKERPLKVAAIMDDFTYSSFKYDADITQLTPSGWKEEIDSSNPELLFVESAWRGVDTLWTNKVAKAPQELRDIVAYCRSRSIPTIFWNKEDPVHLAHFMRAASLFDFVFTTDSDSIPIYRSVLGHSRIYLLPFAAQPAFNNPIEKYERKDKFNFAGSYYRDYKERCRNFDAIMEAALQFRGVDIYDRNFDKDVPDKFRYPERYQQYIKGSLPYSEIDKAYKGYVFAITMNTIKYSSTMFARRAFELVASNTVTVGNYSQGVRYFLGDLTIASDDKDDIIKQLKVITESDLNERKYRLLGLRRVLDQHTYRERLGRIMSKVFADYRPSRDAPKVCVIAVASSQADVDRAVANFKRQDYADKELLVVSAHESIKVPKLARVVSSKSKRLLADATTADYVALIGADTFYGKHYLTDLVLATTYSQADVIGKSAYFARDEQSGSLAIASADTQYKPGVQLGITRSLIRKSHLASASIAKLSKDVAAKKTYKGKGITQSIDSFNLADSYTLTLAEALDVEGYMDINQGEDIEEIYRRSDTISANQSAAIRAKVAKRLKINKTHKITDNPKDT